MDIIRVVSVFLVMSVHFFIYTGFYDQPMLGRRMFVMCAMRTFLSCCVPMFILLSGYLQCRKKPEKKYWLGLSKTLYTYLLTGAACILYQVIFAGKTYTLKSVALEFLKYTAAPYAWYIEMYIGLFLLIPFLNLIYNNLGTQRQKQLLLLVTAVLTVAPTLFNAFDLKNPEWWAGPKYTDALTQVLPRWWSNLYPVTYYFTGCYLREYGLRMKSRTLVVLLAITTLGFTLFNFWRNYGGGFHAALYNNWGAIQPYVTSILLFTLMSRIKGEKLPGAAKFWLWKVSDLCLYIYLVSYIPDIVIYRKLKAAAPSPTDNILWFPLAVACSFLCAVALAAGLKYGGELLARLVKKAARALHTAFTKDKARMQDAVFCLVFIGITVLAVWKCRYGFGGLDESFCLTIPHRLSQGDRLFADEWHLSQLSGLLNVPFVWLYRTVTGSMEGILLAARYLYVLFHGLVALFCYARLRKYGFASVAAVGLYYLFTPYDIMALSYNTMGIDFLLVAGLLLGTCEKRVCHVLGGLSLSASVLCCPYLAAAYLVYGAVAGVQALRGKRGGFFGGSRFLWCSLGVGLAAGAFLLYIQLTCGLGAVLKNLPCMLEDPEHPSTGPAYWLKNYFYRIYICHPWFKVPLLSWTGMLAAMAVDRNRRNHRAFYLIISGLITVTAFAMFYPASIKTYYNAIMFPMVFVGLPAYILCENKPKELFYGVFMGGLLYSVAVSCGSNQFFYVISMACAVSNVASLIFVAQLCGEMRQRPDDVAYGPVLCRCGAALALVLVLVQGFMQFRVKAYHCFWDEEPAALTCTIQAGPAKGLATTEKKQAQYTQQYEDLAWYRTAPQGNILILTNSPWYYLAVDPLPYGTFSAWTSGVGQKALNRLEEYYQGNPGKVPQYICIPKARDAEPDNLELVETAQRYGYRLTESELSYKLER